MNWNGKRVLVTGAAGFIGSHLVEHLVESGARVRALDVYNRDGDQGNLEFLAADKLDALEVVLSDIRDPFAVRQAVRGCEVVFHLAALIGIPYSYVAPQSYVEVNVTGTLNVLEACRAEGVGSMVHTSTSECYGTALYTPIDEKHPLQGQSPYSASKIAADKMAESYHLSFGLPVATVRPFNTYGPRQSGRAVIPTIISQALTRSSVRLGSLSPRRDLTFVTDTARGFAAVAASEAAVGRVTNLGNGKDISIGELAERIAGILGTDVRIEEESARVRPEKSEVMQLLADTTLARTSCGWTPAVSLDEGLALTIEFVREHSRRFQPDLYQV